MSYTAIRDQIKTTLLGVGGIGQVHDYLRVATEPSSLQANFGSGGIVNAWMFSRERTTEERLTTGELLRRYRFVIHGYYQHNDPAASEKTFQDLIEAIATAFRADETLGGTAERIDPVQVQAVGYRILGGSTLCHYCELILEAQEIVT